MKTKRITIVSLFCLLFLAACGEQEQIDNTVVVENGGKGISFRAQSAVIDPVDSYAPVSRTAYTNLTNTRGDNALEWLTGDSLLITCIAANGEKQQARVKTMEGGATSPLKYVGNDTLYWKGDDNTNHDFYAVYPGNATKVGIDESNPKIVNLAVPRYQVVTPQIDGNGNYVCTPDMSYAYMVAKVQTKLANQVSLSFNNVLGR